MKFTIAIFAFFAAFAVIQAAPISVSGNNVGDIVTVGVNAQAVLSNNMEANILTAIIGLLNQQVVVAGSDSPQPFTDMSSLITPELLKDAKNIKITPEMIEQFKNLLKKD